MQSCTRLHLNSLDGSTAFLLLDGSKMCQKVDTSSATSGGAAAVPAGPAAVTVSGLALELQQSHGSGLAHLKSADVFQSHWAASKTLRSLTPPPTLYGSTGSLQRVTSDTTTFSMCQQPEGLRVWWASQSTTKMVYLVLSYLVFIYLNHCSVTDSRGRNVH